MVQAQGSLDYSSRYVVIKQLTNQPPTAHCPVKGKNDETIASQQAQSERWAEHFKEVLNRPSPSITPDFGAETTMPPLDTSLDNFSLKEMKQAIMKLKNNKACGSDDISGEMLKSADDESLGYLLDIMNNVWQNETPPSDWKDGVIFKIPKKGDLSNCNNWRGITLLSIPGKLFCSILMERLRTSVDARLREEQAGFRPHRSCTDHIFTL